MAKTIIIGCRLPHGIVLENPKDARIKVELKGLNSVQIIGAGYYANTVDADFWAAWKEFHKEFAPLKSGAIFEASTESEAAAKAKELKDEKTGFEALSQDGSDGVKVATKD